MMPYERFEAFQACDNLVICIYRVTKSYPSDERYGLTSQTRRAAVSTAANIVEGSARRGSGEFRRFLDIAIGSLAEVSYLLRLAKRLEYLSETQWRNVDELRDRAGRLTWRLYQAVAKKRT
jgi:four helix bundle protein